MPDITVYAQSGCVASQVWIEWLRAGNIRFTQKSVQSETVAGEVPGAGPLATPITVVAETRFLGASRSIYDRVRSLADQSPVRSTGD